MLDTTTVAGSGTIVDPQRMAFMFKEQHSDGTVTYYTSGQKLVDLRLTSEKPDLSNNFSGIYFQLPSEDITNG